MMLADIFMTTKGRRGLFQRSLESFADCTPRDQYRLTIVDDTGQTKEPDDLQTRFWPNVVDYLIVHTQNEGLGPCFNQALAHIDSLKRWDTTPPPLTVYLQDDVLYTKGWLEKLAAKYMQLKGPLKLGFATGIECPEHPWKQNITNSIDMNFKNRVFVGTKDWIRATCMMATHEYWMSMWPVSRIDPETGRERGKPNDGLGSSVDWWFIRNHPNSVCQTGRTNLVMSGLLQHAGYRDSTWLKRELPESFEDKWIIG